jgi:hypothetical protein
VRGSPPDLIDLPPGCAFYERCAYATDDCLRVDPALESVGEGRGHTAACLRSATVAANWRAAQMAAAVEMAGPNGEARDGASSLVAAAAGAAPRASGPVGAAGQP